MITSPVARGQKINIEFYDCGNKLVGIWRSMDRSEGRSLSAREDLELTETGWSRYRLTRANVDQDFLVIRRLTTVDIESRSQKGVKHSSLKVPVGVLVGSQLALYLEQHLSHLKLGRVLEFNYLVPDREMVVAFRAKFSGWGAEGRANVHMYAASILLRPFVPNTDLVFDAQGRFIAMNGRLLNQAGSSRKPELLDGSLKIVQRGLPVHLLTLNCNKAGVNY
ncbi:MAG: hypothetical protein EXR88_00095 [Gammaproteobacteria bacterium]|nr:hypothetical protein [Gammaproteobacteria bacterium]